MYQKTGLRLLQAILLFSFLPVTYAQDSVKTKPRLPGKVNAVPAKIKTSVPPQQPVIINIGVSADKSLNGQYQFISSKIYRYQQPMIDAFYKTIQDSLRIQHSNLAAVKSKLTAQTKSLATLQTDINNKEESLNATNTQVNSINFLGMPVAKATYNTMMWGLVIVLGALAAAIIFLSGSARREAHYRTKLYEELDEEYKTFKVKANDKEKKLARELQTERNKLDELLGRS